MPLKLGLGKSRRPSLPASENIPMPYDQERILKPGHPIRWLTAVIVALLGGLFIFGAFTNPNYQWATYKEYLFDPRIVSAAWNTLQLTAWAMILAVILGLTLAIMRLSSNRVLNTAAWIYLWIFRGTPVYVQLVFWGLFTSLYPNIVLGIPFGHQFTSFNLQSLDIAFYFAIIGLGMNEAAYMAEIVRSGLISVGRGQAEAATALGMTSTLTMKRIVLPQAMRVIIPPSGNELIGLLKTTSLVTAVPYILDLYATQANISGVLYRPVPLLLVASTWYLAITTVMMIGQYYLERHYGKGAKR